MEESTLYKGYRIHTKQLPSGLWLTSVVNLGKQKVTTMDSLTAAVSRIPGEFDSEREAIQAAKQYLDERQP